jgi:hypothetical protein
MDDIVFFVPIIVTQETVGSHAESQWLGKKSTADAKPFSEIRQ